MHDIVNSNHPSNQGRPSLPGKRLSQIRKIVFAGALLIVCTSIIWVVTRPQKWLTYTSRSVGPEHTAIDIVYPADWHIEPGTWNGITDATVATLHPPAPGPLQDWINTHIFRFKHNVNPLYDGEVWVLFQPAHPVHPLNLDSEALQIEKALSTKVLHTTCKIGPVLQFDTVYRSPPQPDILMRAHVVYDVSRSGSLRSEIGVNCAAPRKLMGATFHVGQVLVSHLKLVNNQNREKGIKGK